jgi:hypothetical protein
MVRVMSLALALLAALPAAAQDSGSMENPCGKSDVACRHVATIRLEEPDGTERILNGNLDFPWVDGDNIILVPGDSVTVKLVPDGDTMQVVLVRFGPASATTKPGPGEVRFTLAPSSRGKQVMTAESNYPGMIDYGVLVARIPGGPERVSACTLQPGKPVVETWTGPIYQIALMHFLTTTEPGCKTLNWGQKPVLVQ